MTQQLQKAEREFLQRYEEWLATVEEGLSSVAYFYREGYSENGNRLLQQMLQGFKPFIADNITMEHIFGQKIEHAEEMETFHAKLLEAKRIPHMEKQKQIRYLTTELLPAFQRWKLIVRSVKT